MPNLFLKDEGIEMAPPVVGYRILSHIADLRIEKTSLFDLADHFKDEKWFSPKALYFGMIFLFSVGLLDFQEPYVVVTNAAN